MPLVSVVVPTHNRPETLTEALASVRAQTFTDYEIIVVSNEDDALRRQSLAVATAHGARYFWMPEGNLPAARNFGIEQSKGEWIAFLDDDDLWLPNKLERQLAEAERTRADMIVSACIEFSDQMPTQPAPPRRRMPKPPETTQYLANIIRYDWSAPPSSVIVRKAVLDAVGAFDPLQQYAEDADLWRRISWRHRIHQMDETLTCYRKWRPDAMTANQRALDSYGLRLLFKMLFDTPADLYLTMMPAAILTGRRIIIRMITPRWMRQPRKALRHFRSRFRTTVIRSESPSAPL
jgi:glycosyltransferase involved in cell wall biosynthesis